MVSGDIHRTNYDEVCIRSRKLASALVKDGYKEGDVIATLALNTYRHLEMYYGISGMGAVTHTLNFRLHPEQAVSLFLQECMNQKQANPLPYFQNQGM
ncbi:AMP-binding protein [Gammaproteobacteria bacterium]|nr:AMP-binding protein [Gammaproteobacteria bacterium]